jgi:UDP-N-acetylmuramoyl-L-alanyl-D-glutamate--2,6-diaminopimelate ligase
MAAAIAPVSMTMRQLLPALSLPEAVADLRVQGLCIDSRKVGAGDVFVAMPGLTADGRDYIASALDAGAVAVLAEAEGMAGKFDDRVILISGLNEQLSDIAGRFFDHPSEQLLLTGVTGTNGKTTCSLLLGQLYSWMSGPAGVMGTVGCGVVVDGSPDLRDTGMTTPDAIATQAVLAGYVASGIERAVMEVSSHSLDQYRVQGLCFDTAVFTNLSRDHLDYHKDLVSYAGAKMQLFAMPGLAHAVINVDDPVGAELATRLPSSVALTGYSLMNPNASIYAEDIVLSAAGIQARVHTPWGTGELRSRLLGRFNLQNLLAVIGVCGTQGFSLDTVLSLIPGLQPVVGRMELISLENGLQAGPRVVVDYAHTPDALQKALETLREHCEGKLWCVFGCGGDRDRGKRPQMGNVASRLADRVVVTSDNPRSENPETIIDDICGGIEPGMARGVDVMTCVDRAQAIEFAVQGAADKDIVLVAGKGHEEYQLIGVQRLPFSDQSQVRLALRQRGVGDDD